MRSNLIEGAKEGVKKISGPVFTKIGCGMTGGSLVAWYIGSIAPKTFWEIFAIAFVFIVIGSALEFLIQ